MPGPDPEDAQAGDRVTLVDPQGLDGEYEGVANCIHSPGTINALYRPDGDGSFKDPGHAAEYTIATSLTPARQDGATHAYRMGWGQE